MKPADPFNCSVAATLDIIGEGWTLLIIREAFLGTRRFADFQRHLGIARNILSDRLKKLTRHAILKRVPIGPGAKRHEYRLTGKGRELLPLLVALTQWGDRWINPDGAPLTMVDRRDGLPIRPLQIQAADGRPLGLHDLALAPGPGASEATLARLKALK
ncbi:MAG TPA: transcriptional regulator [Chromatiaceae bacterium]|nr:transcriptional regulator [Chromatiaceae bacterium]